MFYVVYHDYDVSTLVARFSYREDAEFYAKVMSVIDTWGDYEVEDLEELPLNPEIEGVAVMRKGKFYKHFREVEEARKWISRRKIPADYTLSGPEGLFHTSHQD